jgi:hypothetical protein
VLVRSLAAREICFLPHSRHGIIHIQPIDARLEIFDETRLPMKGSDFRVRLWRCEHARRQLN